MMKGLPFCLLMVFGFGSAVRAGYSFEEVAVEYWAGQGSNRAMVVVDFADDLSFAFGYQWEGEKTSYDALLAIDACSADFTMLSHWDDSLGGWFVDDLDYLGVSPRGSSWSFFTASDGQNWQSSWLGASERVLSDGDWDGWASGEWVWVGPGAWDWAFTGTVHTPIPEPASIGLLGLMSVLVVRKGR
ncbi:MAG TPA: hypothetical protein PLP49_03075 [Anaerohalosphaeraceae bacterium]|nr:hypothetical protein [Anaerohalosphaeraceae bacterium]HPB92332.1 hypothetical protein [Anaerohalosphaeraceae bacterium]HRT22945.1 hypothetical protein [Anaerohalosphaeraceae bacterium]